MAIELILGALLWWWSPRARPWSWWSASAASRSPWQERTPELRKESHTWVRSKLQLVENLNKHCLQNLPDGLLRRDFWLGFFLYWRAPHFCTCGPIVTSVGVVSSYSLHPNTVVFIIAQSWQRTTTGCSCLCSSTAPNWRQSMAARAKSARSRTKFPQ